MKTDLRVLLLFLGGILASPSSYASETDQYHDRAVALRDSRGVINDRVNKRIRKAVDEWRGGVDFLGLAEAIRKSVDGAGIWGRMTFWSKTSGDVDRVDTIRHSIYRSLPAVKGARVFLLSSPTIRVNGTRFGTDKFSHMFSQGWNYFVDAQKYGMETALRNGVESETGALGLSTTGVFSNADLVANFEGFQFYRSLFEDGVIPAKSALVKWDNAGTPIVQRDFDIDDHVNAYWDESINTNFYPASTEARILENILKLCPEYYDRPELFTIDPALDVELSARYAGLGLRQNRTKRLQDLCM
ncbi:MAG: hypothetical protein A2603_15980 [Bdellovibrionales bacterium RIFOXYD1_FULL_55_31]|nr:MAG: hypothetical protein A2603_15980 [Bdellovibrionales bacterium RIFOXYD1_FULL_55_31]